MVSSLQQCHHYSLSLGDYPKENHWRKHCLEGWPIIIGMLEGDRVIIGGDINFYLGEGDIWGPKSQKDPLADYFLRILDEKSLFDILVVKVMPTWRNKRIRQEKLTKRLKIFLVNKGAMQSTTNLRQWVGEGGDSDHFPIFLEAVMDNGKPPVSFKFNSCWMEDKECKNMVKRLWIPFEDNNHESTGIQFLNNLKIIEIRSISWATKRRKRHDMDLKNIEQLLDVFHDIHKEGLLTLD